MQRGKTILLGSIFCILGLCPVAAKAQQACSDVAVEPIGGGLDFGRAYIGTGSSGEATLDPATGAIVASGRFAAVQGGNPVSIEFTTEDEPANCEFLLTVSPADHDLVSGFRAEVDRLHVAQGTLVSSNAAEREWVVRMTSAGTARVSMGGRLSMTTSSDSVLGTFAVPFTATVSAP